jgi:hypothetical protein
MGHIKETQAKLGLGGFFHNNVGGSSELMWVSLATQVIMQWITLISGRRAQHSKEE